MEDSKTRIMNEVDAHLGELVLDCFDVVKLLGFHEDEEDYWYKFRGVKGTYYSSCVGTFYPLKGVLPEEQYNRMVEVYNLNVDMWCMTDKQNQIDWQFKQWENKWYGDAR